ncbi:MAG: hypothetical protein C5B50_04675 [Verrucomicrobia bacterium]|nr:MAG: hypothetical protein C5B50_04675 [Verrucomicrobiota bacterium]
MLTELRKLRKLNLFTLILTLVSAAGCVLLIIAFLIGAQYRSTRQTTARTSSRSNPWSQVRTAVEEQDFARALTLANDVIARNPSDYYGYTYLGYVYLALGDLTNSQANYQRAFELWPVEENEKNLNAIKSRIAIEHQKQLEKK